MSRFLRKNAVFLYAAFFAGVVTSQLSAATTIFNNSVNDLNLRFNPGTYEVGDQVTNLAGTDRLITGFSFEYWGTNTANPSVFSSTVHAEVRFYLNNGATFNGYASPGTMFYDSGLFAVSPTSRATIVFDASDFGGGVFLNGESFTWTVQFSGMGGTDSIGVDLYNPPTVGSDYPDYWENQGSGWALRTNSLTSTMNFAAVVTATVPEPSAIALSLLGGFGLFFTFGRLRRKQ
jgi:hypothetical protein